MRITNRANLPQSIVLAAEKFTQAPSPDVIRVTQLIDSPLVRKLSLKHWDELEDDASDRLWAILGTAIHAVFEGHTEFGAEERISVVIDGVTISGQADLYDSESKTMTDYKSTSVWSIIYPEQRKKWEQQLNVYAYLFSTKGKTVESLKVVALLRDWQKSKAAMDPGYPQTAVVTVSIQLWDTEKQESYIKERISLHNSDYICNDEDRWAKPTVFAVMKGDNKRAAKLFDNKDEAESFASTDPKFHVVERPGEDTRCLEYCPVRSVCPHKRNQENE